MARVHTVHQRGFTLIEVLVTVFIIGASVSLYAAAASTVAVTRHAKFQSIATRVAAHHMEELRAGGYDALPVSGTFSHSDMDALPSGTGEVEIDDYNASTKEVTVTVGWQEGGKSARSVSLTTLITEVGGL